MSRVLVIGSGETVLKLRLPPVGMPQIVSFGDSGADGLDLAGIERAGRVNGMDEAVPSAVLLPAGGMGFFGWPAIAGHRHGRDFILQFSSWSVQETGEGAILTAADEVAGMAIRIVLAAHTGGVLSMRAALTNRGREDYTLDRCMAASFLVGGADVSITSFTGMWGREFQMRREMAGNGVWLQESRRGRTSHDRLPMIYLDSAARRFGAALGWSGNHVIAIDRLDDGRRLVHLGELFEPGEMILKPGQTYESPPAYAGANPGAFHEFVRSGLLNWPGGAMRPRPVTLNTWEGNYFDHRMPSLKEQAAAAAALGIERFVLDDGWFGRRDDDTSSLGDWDVDPRKYPEGLKPIVDHVTGLGMEFGIWFEPEMVNPRSALFQAHPDWALQAEGRPLLLSRSQLVLDLSRAEVCEHLFSRMDAVLANHAVSCLKWDMNRDLTHACDEDGRARMAAQTRAVYALMDRIQAAHPGLEIESCASGGGRVDFGVLERTCRVWTSDCTDALERLEIQRGASAFLPPEILGSHVSACPNHQTGRRHSLAFRALTAMAYHFGVELNPLDLGEEERAELALYIAEYKRLRSLLHARGGNFHLDPVDGRHVWGATSGRRIVLFVAQGAAAIAEQPAPLVLPETLTRGGGRWRIAHVLPKKPNFICISDGQRRLLAGEIGFGLESLRGAGLPLPAMRPESAVMLEIEPLRKE